MMSMENSPRAIFSMDGINSIMDNGELMRRRTAEAIKAATASGRSMASICREADVDNSYISKYLKGDFIPTIDKAKRIADAVGVTVGWLAGEIELMPVPVIGEVPGGRPVTCEEIQSAEIKETVDFPSDKKSLRGVYVRGSSMNRVAPDGQIIIIDCEQRDASLLDGELVIANVNGESTFKRLRLNPTRLVPESTDPSFQEIFPKDEEEWEIVARVIGAISDWRKKK